MHGNRGDRERELLQAHGPEGAEAPTEELNARAVQVIRRVENKLTGRDFGNERLEVDQQPPADRVDQPVDDLQSHIGLVVSYQPFRTTIFDREADVSHNLEVLSTTFAAEGPWVSQDIVRFQRDTCHAGVLRAARGRIQFCN